MGIGLCKEMLLREERVEDPAGALAVEEAEAKPAESRNPWRKPMIYQILFCKL